MPSPCIILCGGRATRLAVLWPDRPKALVPVAGRPFLEWQMEWLARGGVRRIHLAAGHRGEMVIEWLHDWLSRTDSGPDMITCSIEPAPLGTGGGLRYAADRVEGDPVLVLNGDSLLPRFSDFQPWTPSSNKVPTLGQPSL